MASKPVCYRCRRPVGPNGALVSPEPEEYEAPVQRLIPIPPLWVCGYHVQEARAFPAARRVQLVLLPMVGGRMRQEALA